MIIIALVIDSNSIVLPGKNRVAKATNDLRNILSTLQIYKLENANYPSAEQGLLALVEKPLGEPVAVNWQDGGYLDRLPKDPWKRNYLYRNPGVVDPVEIYSFGRDGKLGGCLDDADLYSSTFESAASNSLKCKSYRLLDGIMNWFSNNRFLFAITLIILGLLMVRAARITVKPACGTLYRFIGWAITGLGGTLLLLLMWVLLFVPKFYY